jgi:hypothetical protein
MSFYPLGYGPGEDTGPSGPAVSLLQQFKVIAKLAYARQAALAHAEAYKRLAMATVDQGVSGVAAEFEAFQRVMTPLNVNAKAAVTAVSRVADRAGSLAEAYLTSFVGPSVGADPDADAAAVLAVVAGQMTDAGLYLETDLAAFFGDVLGFDGLPTTGATAVPDAWMTDAVI